MSSPNPPPRARVGGDGSGGARFRIPGLAVRTPRLRNAVDDPLLRTVGAGSLIATRSPGLVVSADSEQLITMNATAGPGDVEACGCFSTT